MLKKALLPENIFAIFALIFGLIIAFKTPTFRGLDEPVHFFRVYQISQFQHGATATLPKNMVDAIDTNYFPADWTNPDTKNFLNINIDKSETIKRDISNSAVYSPVAYLPQSLGLVIAMLFTKNLFFLSYLVRILGLATYILLVSIAIKKAPVLKWFMMFIALLPVCLAQSSVLSADAITYALVFLLLSLILSLLKNEYINPVCLTIVCAILCLAKQAYFPLILLLVCTKLTPRIKATVFIVSGICLLGWQSIINGICVTNPLLSPDNCAIQIETLKIAPLFFIKVLVKTFFRDGFIYTSQAVGSTFAWDIPLSLGAVWGVLILFLIPTLAVLDGGLNLSKFNRIFSILLAGGNIVLISAVFFTTWTPANIDTILGMQGRYFTPLLLPLGLSLSGKQSRRLAPILAITSSLVLLVAFSKKFL